MSQNIFLENQFAMINVVGQGGFGRVFKMKHLKTGIMVAVKERLRNEEKMIKEWKKEISVLEMIDKKIPDLTTSRYIGTLDEKMSNTKEKYILIEWIEGKLFFFILFYHSLFLLFKLIFILLFFYFILFNKFK